MNLKLTCVLLMCTAVAAALAPEKQLRAGAARSNVTPWLGLSLSGHFNDRRADQVHDELYARCIVLDNGMARLGIAVVDNCMIPREVFDEAKRIVTERDGIPADHLLMSATHTHSGPCTTPVFQSDPTSEYNVFLARRIADGISRAVKNLEPARIAWGSGSVPDQVFNRRWRMKPGTVGPNPFGGTTDVVRMNPGRENPNLVEPAGPTDPEVPFLSVQAADGRPIALLANYSLHYVGASGNDVSADYFGMFARTIEQELGQPGEHPPFVGMMSNGTSGDINNINFREAAKPQAPYEQTRLVAGRVAAEVLRVYPSLEYLDWVELQAMQQELECGVRLPSEKDVTRAKAIMAKAAGPEMVTAEEVYARETVHMAEYPPTVKLLVQAVQIGDVGISAMPCEVFVAFGLKLKRESPFPRTFTIELANGYNGYLPTAQQHRWGGYETWRARSSYLEPNAGHVMVDALLGLFNQLKAQ